jgi:eukaryotic-like serine/threonine-protein kinase
VSVPDISRGAERFELRRRLGQGSYGVVFEAYDRKSDRDVALKKLRSLEPGALRRFKREFRAFTDISHPNLVRLGELLNDGGDWYFTMELVAGVDILSYIWEGQSHPAEEQSGRAFRSRFDEPRLRESFAQLAEAVHALHAHGLVHRDLKPSNVLVTRGGRVVVLDFGLVWNLDGTASGSAGLLAGTPAYMAPEQCTGTQVSAASDWYAVGTMLYEALTGRLPFGGSLYQMIAQRLVVDAPSPRQIAQRVPADLDELCTSLLQVDADKRPSGEAILRLLRPAAPGLDASPRAPSEGVFIGRDEQLAALWEAVRHVRDGGSATVLIEGESGIGKTALARHFVAELQARVPDALVLAGRCYQREAVPFKAFDAIIDALSRYLDALDPVEAARLLPRDWPALERLFPVLRDLGATIGGMPGFEIPNMQELRQRGFAALRQLLAKLAERHTIALVIDDLQWGDVDSGNLLRELLRPPNRPRFLLLACYRSEDGAAAPFLRWLTESERGDVQHRKLVLGRLSEEDTHALAMALVGRSSPEARHRAAALARESGGNPFLIDELARFELSVGGTGLPEIRLASLIQARLERLPQAARELLEVIAVAGQPMEASVANQAAGLDPRDLATIEYLHAEKWVRRRANVERELFEPYHDRLRETVIALVAAERLPSYHNRLAAAWEASGVADAETLADHYRSAGESELAARHARRAAEQAADALAFDRAARLYQLSLDLWEPGDEEARRAIRIELGHTLVNAGRGAEAARCFLAAAESAPRNLRFELTRAAAEQLLLSGNIDDGLRVLGFVLETVGLRLAASPARALPGVVVRRLWLALRGYGYVPRRPSEVAPELLRRIDVCSSLSVGLAMVDMPQGQHFHAINMLLALRAGEPYRVARALLVELGISAIGGSRTRERTERIHRQCQELVTELNQAYTDGFFALMDGIAAYLCGDYARALEQSRQGEAILRERCTGVTWELDTACVYELLALVQLGRWRELAELAPARYESARERSDAYLTTFFKTRIEFLPLLMAGDVDQARRAQRDSLRGWSGIGFQVQHYWDWYAIGEIDLYDRRALDGWARLHERWGRFRLSLLPLTQSVRTEIYYLRARLALAVAAEYGGAVGRAMLRRAAKASHRLAAERVPHATALSLLLRACVAARLDAATPDLLIAAEEALTATGHLHHAAAARWRRGQLIGGDEGAAAIAGAESWMSGQGVRHPERMLWALAPGRST